MRSLEKCSDFHKWLLNLSSICHPGNPLLHPCISPTHYTCCFNVELGGGGGGGGGGLLNSNNNYKQHGITQVLECLNTLKYVIDCDATIPSITNDSTMPERNLKWFKHTSYDTPNKFQLPGSAADVPYSLPLSVLQF